MKTALAFALTCAATVSLALATGSVATLTDIVRNTLTTIDTVPTKLQLDHAFGGAALSNLSTIARDKDIDIGVRVRAIHGLGKYCPDPCSDNELAHKSLTTLIEQTRNETLGEPVVLLRAAIETLGTLRVTSDVYGEGDVDVNGDGVLWKGLLALLDHPSRDIRGATTRALRDLCNNQAVTPLRVRYTNEPTEQVKLAISEALRILGQCGM